MRLTVDRAAQLRFSVKMFVFGVFVMIAAKLTPDALNPEVFGRMAYDVDEETWAMGFMGFAMMVLYGLHINGRWRWSPMLRCGGYVGLIALFATLGLSALQSEYGLVIAMFIAVLIMPEYLRYLRINISDAIARIRYGRD